ncbi:MAG: hypothetical protein VKK62_03295 [Synechococcaceae cyanobacterium]|nr:hypothetical protein [Synechococcaceae cyanobacterium]
MSCPKCGCRIVAKLGRGRSMLICADCSHPLDTNPDPAQRRRTLLAVLSMAGILAVGSTVLLLDSIHDSLHHQHGYSLEADAETEASGEAE